MLVVLLKVYWLETKVHGVHEPLYTDHAVLEKPMTFSKCKTDCVMPQGKWI